MKLKFLKKATALAVTAAMLTGNVFTAFAASTQDAGELPAAYVEETQGGAMEADVTESGILAGDATEPDILVAEGTEAGSGEEDANVEDSTEDVPEDTIEGDPPYERSGPDKWINWTDWDNDSIRDHLADSLFWTTADDDFYAKNVSEESSNSLEAYIDAMTLEDWEEVFGIDMKSADLEEATDNGEMLEAYLLFCEKVLEEYTPGTGKWVEDEIGYYYLQEDGSRAIGWQELEEDLWYYFDEDGYRMTGWFKDGKTWYYFSEIGVMYSNTNAYIDGEEYHFRKSGAMHTGWLQEADGDWCYFKSNGAMATGWQKVGSTWYYLGYNGVMKTGWQRLDGAWYYLKPSGAMATGWQKVNGVWYYLKPSGAMKTGWLQDGANWYYLRESGAMQTDWLQLGDNWFYFYSNGVMAKDTMIGTYYVDKNGYYVSSYMSDAQIMGKLNYLKIKYPNGRYWNHMGVYVEDWEDTSEIVTDTPCQHYLYNIDGYGYCNEYTIYNADIEGRTCIYGYQCAGFAFKLSDEIFGVDADRIYYDYNFDAIRLGDTIRTGEYFGNSGHSFVVIEKNANNIKVAECNAGNTCIISWGRTITRAQLNSEYKVYCETRRP